VAGEAPAIFLIPLTIDFRSRTITLAHHHAHTSLAPAGPGVRTGRGLGATLASEWVSAHINNAPTCCRGKWQETSDGNAVVIALDKVAQVEDAATRYSNGFAVYRSDQLSVTVWPPYWWYRLQIIEALRKREPLDAVALPTSVRIDVFAFQIDAPDIEKVILERNRKVIVPTSSDLHPRAMRTALGAQAVLHEGSVHYPCAAFLPGAEVTITAIPAVGVNVVKTFTPEELTLITGHDIKPVERINAPTVQSAPVELKRPGQSPAPTSPSAPPTPPKTAIEPSETLIGRSDVQVRARLGSPSLSSNGILYYDMLAGTLKVTMTGGVVTDVSPRGFELAGFKARGTSTQPAPPSGPPPPPIGAVARCNDGQFVFVSTGSKTCSKNGGVAEWLNGAK
jgi:hypothetical protein